MECLAQRTLSVQQAALASGALVPLQTDVLELPAAEPFVIRRLLSDTPKHLRRAGPKPNPFRPWDPRLEVCRIDEHVVLLNKYPVQPGHLLLITQTWQPQNGWLTLADFEALASIWREQRGLWFFNSGPDAGASQPHRHLQLLPRSAQERPCPMEGVYRRQLAGEAGEALWQQKLCCRELETAKGCSGATLLRIYQEMADVMGLGDASAQKKPVRPYNLLIARDWMVMVPRKQEAHAGFSVNALGFAGYLLATSEAQLPWLKSHGPSNLLDQVCG
jgi:ATP adenylyltransferase